MLRKLQAIATHLKVVLTGPSLLVLVVCDVVWRTHFSDLDGTFTIGALASVLRTFCFVAVAMVVVVVLDGPPEVPRWMCLALVLGVANTASTLVSWDRLVVARVWNVEVVLKDFYLSTYSQLLLVFLSITTLLVAGLTLYYVGTFWLYLQSHHRMRNVSLVGVLYAYTRRLTIALVCVTSVAKKIQATMRMVMAMAMCGFMSG